MESLVRSIFAGASSPLDLECSNVLSVNAKTVHEIWDYVYQLYYCGQRKVS